MRHVALKLVGDTTGEPVSAAEIKPHLRVESTSTESDTIIDGYIAAARKRIEERTRRALLIQTFDFAFDGPYPDDAEPIVLPKAPLAGVSSIVSYGSTGDSSTLSTDAYFVDAYSEPGRVCLNGGYSWPSGKRDLVTGVIRFTAGYSTSSTGIPGPLLQAIRMTAGHWFENREQVQVTEPGAQLLNLPDGVEECIADYVLPEAG